MIKRFVFFYALMVITFFLLLFFKFRSEFTCFKKAEEKKYIKVEYYWSDDSLENNDEEIYEDFLEYTDEELDNEEIVNMNIKDMDMVYTPKEAVDKQCMV